MDSSIIYAFLLTLFAGLATGIGGLIVFFSQQTNTRFLSFSLGLSAGVMILVSFGEFLVTSREILSAELGGTKGLAITWICFFIGIAFIAIIDKLIPAAENPHEMRHTDLAEVQGKGKSLMRMGVFTALAIGIHNFPEGMATLIAAIENPTVGIAIAIAVAIHNIPEGIAVAIPIYQSTQSKKKAFLSSLSSGLAEPIGAIVAYWFLMPYINEVLMAKIFAIVAGIMVFISLDELLPATHAYDEHHIAIYGLIVGMALMATSLVIMV